MIFVVVVVVVFIVIGGFFFLFGWRGVENGKMYVGYVLMGVGVILVVVFIVVLLFGLFG